MIPASPAETTPARNETSLGWRDAVVAILLVLASIGLAVVHVP